MVVEGGTVIAKVGGSAESEVFEQLATFIGNVQAEVGRTKAIRVVADLRELEFATSSCLKVFASWLISVAEKPDKYQVEFLSNPEYQWQRRSLRALSACAPDVVEVTA